MKRKYLIYEGIEVELPNNINVQKFLNLEDITKSTKDSDVLYIVIERNTFTIEEYLRINLLSMETKTQVLYIYVPLIPLSFDSKKQNEEPDVININAQSNEFEKEELTKTCDTIIFSAHGEGCHLNLNNIVLCACKNKDDQKKCRKSTNKKVVFLEETDANNYIFLSCNSALFNEELYPTEKNLLFTALEISDYVIASTSPIILREEYINLLKRGLYNGLDLVSLTYLLNEMYNFQYGIAPFVCCSKKFRVFLEKNMELESKLSKKNNSSEEILLITSDSVSNVFRFADYRLSFNQDSYECKSITLDMLSNKQKSLFQYISFLQNFFSFLELQKSISVKEKTTVDRVFETLKKKLFQISIEIHSISLVKITTFHRYNAINKGLELINKACFQQSLLASEKGYFYNYFEPYIEYCFNKREHLLSDYQCNRCRSQLSITRLQSFFEGNEITKYDCPVCGVHSIYFGKNNFLKHGYINNPNYTTIFFHGDTDVHVSYFRLYNKSKGEIWSEKKKADGHRVFINTIGLNADVHSYKMLCLAEEGIVYIHGKFIKEYE